MEVGFMSYILFIAGPSASGKTKLAKDMQQILGRGRVLHISMDQYYYDTHELGAEALKHLNFDCPTMIDVDLLVQHLNSLQSGKSICLPRYNYNTMARTIDKQETKPVDIIIVEGILALHYEQLRAFIQTGTAEGVYLATPFSIWYPWRIKRDHEERERELEMIKHQCKEIVTPMLDQYVKPTRIHATYVFYQCGKEEEIIIDYEKIKLDKCEEANFQQIIDEDKIKLIKILQTKITRAQSTSPHTRMFAGEQEQQQDKSIMPRPKSPNDAI